jgi:hypothetical protein
VEAPEKKQGQLELGGAEVGNMLKGLMGQTD